MSDCERNKGKLIPVSWDTICKALEVEGLEEDFYEFLDRIGESGKYEQIGDDWYEIVWEVKRSHQCDYFADVTKNEDGSIDFHTMHYNGGAHWTEVVEGALNE